MLHSITALLAVRFEFKQPQKLQNTNDYIRLAVEELIDQATLYDHKMENNHLVKRQIFLNLLEGVYESEQQYQEQLNKQNLSFKSEKCLLSIVEIDGHTQVLAKSNDSQTMFLQKKMLRVAIQPMGVHSCHLELLHPTLEREASINGIPAPWAEVSEIVRSESSRSFLCYTEHESAL